MSSSTNQEEEFSFDEVFEYEYCNCFQDNVLLPNVDKKVKTHDLKNNSDIIFEKAEKEAIEFSELFIQNGKI